MIKHKNDKSLNKIPGNNRHECHFYKQMDMWNGWRANIINQMLANAEEDDKQHNIQNTQHNSPLSIAKDEKKKFQKKMGGILKQIFSNSSNLIASFHSIV